MVLTCLTQEGALQDVLRLYQEHQVRLNSWIEELTERGSELLTANFVQVESDAVGAKQARTISGLQVAARSLFTTAMQLSKEQLQSAIRLARSNVFPQAGSKSPAHKPCAPEDVSDPSTHKVEATETAVSAELKTACVDSEAAAPASATRPATPVRATVPPKPESLVDILAREAEEALKGLNPQEINRSIRDYRRQREKELKQALKG